MLNYISVPLFLFDEGRNIQAKKISLMTDFFACKSFLYYICIINKIRR